MRRLGKIKIIDEQIIDDQIYNEEYVNSLVEKIGAKLVYVERDLLSSTNILIAEGDCFDWVKPRFEIPFYEITDKVIDGVYEIKRC